VENNVVIFQKIKRNCQKMQQLHFHIYTQKNRKQGLKETIEYPCFVVALGTVAKNGMPDVVMHICNPCFLRGRGSRIKACTSPAQKT
jgi:hypothetical protein